MYVLYMHLCFFIEEKLNKQSIVVETVILLFVSISYLFGFFDISLRNLLLLFGGGRADNTKFVQNILLCMS